MIPSSIAAIAAVPRIISFTNDIGIRAPDSFHNRGIRGRWCEGFLTGRRGLHRLQSRGRSFNMPGRYLRYRTGIGWEQGGPRRKKKVGQQSGGQHVILNGLPEESMAVSKGLSQIMTSE